MKKFLKEWGTYLIILIVIVLFKIYVATPVMVRGESMYSTLHNKDVMILNELYYRFNDIERFDIVVFPYKYDLSNPTEAYLESVEEESKPKTL